MKPKEVVNSIELLHSDGVTHAKCAVMVNADSTAEDLIPLLKHKLWEKLYGDIYRAVRDIRETNFGAREYLLRKLEGELKL